MAAGNHGFVDAPAPQSPNGRLHIAKVAANILRRQQDKRDREVAKFERVRILSGRPRGRPSKVDNNHGFADDDLEKTSGWSPRPRRRRGATSESFLYGAATEHTEVARAVSLATKKRAASATAGVPAYTSFFESGDNDGVCFVLEIVKGTEEVAISRRRWKTLPKTTPAAAVFLETHIEGLRAD